MHNRSMLLIIPVLAVLLVGTVSTSHAEFPSPLKQIQDGTDPNDIRCNDGMVHAVRDDGRHACVKEATADRFNWQIIITIISAIDDGHGAASQHCSSPASCQHLYDEITIDEIAEYCLRASPATCQHIDDQLEYHYGSDAQRKAESKPNRSANVIDTFYGEYPSPGNTWIELTHSRINLAPWFTESYLDILRGDFDLDVNDPLSDREVIEWFYAKYDIKVLDAIKSIKYKALFDDLDTATLATYHILVSDEDYEKFKKMSFGFVRFGELGTGERYPEPYQGENFADWNAEKILISSSGDIELKLELDYDSEIPKRTAYYCPSCDEPTYVTKDLRFVNSTVFLTYSSIYDDRSVLRIVADGESPQHATVDYSGIFEFPEPDPRLYNYGEMGLSWVRIFEDSEGKMYHQRMDAEDTTIIKLDSPYTASGGFDVDPPYLVTG